MRTMPIGTLPLSRQSYVIKKTEALELRQEQKKLPLHNMGPLFFGKKEKVTCDCDALFSPIQRKVNTRKTEFSPYFQKEVLATRAKDGTIFMTETVKSPGGIRELSYTYIVTNRNPIRVAYGFYDSTGENLVRAKTYDKRGVCRNELDYTLNTWKHFDRQGQLSREGSVEDYYKFLETGDNK